MRIEEVRAWVKLLQAREVGNQKAARLIEKLGNPIDFIGKGTMPLAEVDFLPERVITELASPEPPELWEYISRTIEKFDIKLVSVLDDNYPRHLKGIYYTPPILFYIGNMIKEDFNRTLAIVGTRKTSTYGKVQCEILTRDLVRGGFTIISGLAHGIDTLAHRTTLENNGKTYAVMGTPCDQIYPSSNKGLAKQIIREGAIISEFMPGIAINKGFPRRNRIISGISLGSLIIEGSRTSGALITAKNAVDQGRYVFALPGDITREQAEGPNYLIKLGATPVTSADDIFEVFDMTMEKEEQLTVFPQLDVNEDKVYQVLLEHKPEIDIDKLYLESGLSLPVLSSVLLNLDLKGVIKRMPGNRIAPMY
ncbi:MAG: DNA-processing protein DprA [Candidatus Cloacimonetes bacterium]|nr:DNA-processing protein DprA [Candidatus Cloacimonadota bacterium]